MILRNNLYTVVDKEEIPGGASYRIRIHPQHFIYAAHFPDEPITPGVCVLQIGQELLAEETGRTLALKKIRNAKFTAVISPRQLTELEVLLTQITETDDEVACQCVIKSKEPEAVCAKLSFTCMQNG